MSDFNNFLNLSQSSDAIAVERDNEIIMMNDSAKSFYPYAKSFPCDISELLPQNLIESEASAAAATTK